MSQKLSTIELIPRARPGETLSNTAFRTERRFFDFVVDGLSLRETIARNYDLTSVLWIDAPVPTEIAKSIRRLLLIDPGDLPDGRVALYTCPECGDLGCGGITVDIKLSEDAIVWSKFGYQNDYDNVLRTDAFHQYGAFRFEVNHYRAVLLCHAFGLQPVVGKTIPTNPPPITLPPSCTAPPLHHADSMVRATVRAFQQISAATTIPSSATVSLRTWGKGGLSLPNVYSVIEFKRIKTWNRGSPRAASLARQENPGLPPQLVAASRL